jgi:hypothetical protein
MWFAVAYPMLIVLNLKKKASFAMYFQILDIVVEMPTNEKK